MGQARRMASRRTRVMADYVDLPRQEINPLETPALLSMAVTPPLQGVRDALRLVVGQTSGNHEDAWNDSSFQEEGFDQLPEVVPISGDQNVRFPHRKLELIEIGKAAPADLMNADGIETETPRDLCRFGREVFVEEKGEERLGRNGVAPATSYQSGSSPESIAAPSPGGLRFLPNRARSTAAPPEAAPR